MAKITSNSYPLDGIKADINIIDWLVRTNVNDIDHLKEAFAFRFVNFVVPNLKELGEEVFKPKSIKDCIDKLEAIVKAKTPIKNGLPNFRNEKQTDESNPDAE